MTEPPKKIWTPDQKVPESVRKMAFLFFLECFKVNESRTFMPGATNAEWDHKTAYRECIKVAKSIHEIDAENEPPK